jgi:hypothetical protein
MTEAELDAGADPRMRGYWETLTSDGARPLPSFTPESASAWLIARGSPCDFRVVS